MNKIFLTAWMAFLSIFLFIFLFGCITTPKESVSEKEAPAVVNITVSETEIQPAGETSNETVSEGAQTGGTVSPQTTDALTAIAHKEISFTTKDGWKIYGTLYYSGSNQDSRPTKVIVLIPQLGKDRNSYNELVPLLHSAIPGADIVALDMRGHGKSTNLGTYQAFQTGDFRASKNDLSALKDYLGVSRPSITTYYLVGASIGSSIAIDYAASHGEAAKVVMISPGIAYHNFDITDEAQTYLHDLYIVSASEDSYSMASANTIYANSPSDKKVLKIYYGISSHGTDLFNATKDKEQPLLPLIVDWLK